MKKIILVMMCLVMTLTAGCIGKNAGTNSAEEIVESVLGNLAKVESLCLECNTDSSMSVMGSWVDSRMTAICKVDIANKIQYVSTTIDASGQQNMVECYVKENESDADVYLNVNGAWMKQSSAPVEKVDELGLSTDSYKLMSLYLELVKDNCTVSKEKKDGKECYVLAGKIDADNNEILGKVGLGNTLNNLVQSGLTSSQIQKIISDVGEIGIVIYVDKELLLPTQIDIDITDVTQNIMDGLAEVLQESGDINVEKNIAVSKYSMYNEIEKLTIPEEALTADEVTVY